MQNKIKLRKYVIMLLLFFAVNLSSHSCVYGLGVPVTEPLSSEFQDYVKTKPSGFNNGYIPSPVKTKNNIISNNKRHMDIDLPSYYDLRTANKLSSIKTQLGNDCWAFSAIASLESSLMPAESYDFSENNLVNKNGFDWSDGGNDDMATAYFARWGGPVLESQDPYVSTSPLDILPSKHVQNVEYIAERDVDIYGSSTVDQDIKTAIMQYGAVSSSIYWDDAYYNSSTSSFYMNQQQLQLNHAIDIVGWDDNYSKDNFAVQPSGNGAFICRNSWGTDFGDNGYFYISYYDLGIGKEGGAVFCDAEDVNNFDHIYQYDPLGCINYRGYSDSETAWFANAFTSQEDEKLSAVSFYTQVKGALYTIYLRKGFTDANSMTSSYLVQIGQGVLAMPGYHTIPIDTMYDLSIKGQSKFAVAVKLTTPGSIYSVPIEYPEQYYSSGATGNVGESYISYDGTCWDDVNANSYGINNGNNENVCLKAFTINIPSIKGDADSDGYVTSKDADLIKSCLSGKSAVTSINNTDIDGDGKITSLDYALLNRYISGKIKALP